MREDLRHPRVLKKIGEFASTGMRWSAISRALEKDLGVKASSQTVRRIYKQYVMKTRDIINADSNMKEEFKRSILNQKDILESIYAKVLNILQRAEEANSPKLELQAIDRVVSLLNTQEKILNRLKQDVNTSYSLTSVTTDIVSTLNDMEKQGYIKILKKPPVEVEYSKEEQE